MQSNVIGQIEAIRGMTVAELRVEWERLYDEPTRSRNRDYLWKRLAWRVQELAHGGLSDAAKQCIDDLAPEGFVRARTPAQALPDAAGEPPATPRPQRPRDARLPTPGSVIVRQYKNRELRLTVRDDHFELDGQAFRSLSEAARHVTGSKWNGRLFWGLTERKR